MAKSNQDAEPPRPVLPKDISGMLRDCITDRDRRHAATLCGVNFEATGTRECPHWPAIRVILERHGSRLKRREFGFGSGPNDGDDFAQMAYICLLDPARQRLERILDEVLACSDQQKHTGVAIGGLQRIVHEQWRLALDRERHRGGDPRTAIADEDGHIDTIEIEDTTATDPERYTLGREMLQRVLKAARELPAEGRIIPAPELCVDLIDDLNAHEIAAKHPDMTHEQVEQARWRLQKKLRQQEQNTMNAPSPPSNPVPSQQVPISGQLRHPATRRPKKNTSTSPNNVGDGQARSRRKPARANPPPAALPPASLEGEQSHD